MTNENNDVDLMPHEWREYAARLGRMVAEKKSSFASALGTMNRAFSKTNLKEELQERVMSLFTWYSSGKAPPSNALATVWDIATRHGADITTPAWCPDQYRTLYLTALILGINGRMFTFACPALSKLSGMHRGSIFLFRQIACNSHFFFEVQPGQRGGSATLFAVCKDYESVLSKSILDEINAKCSWLLDK